MKRLLIILLLSVPVLSFAQKSVRYRADVELNPGLGLIQMGQEQAEDYGYEIPLRYLYAGAGLGTVQGIEIKDRIFLGAGLNIIGSAVFNGNGSSCTASMRSGMLTAGSVHSPPSVSDSRDAKVYPLLPGLWAGEYVSGTAWTWVSTIRWAVRRRVIMIPKPARRRCIPFFATSLISG